MTGRQPGAALGSDELVGAALVPGRGDIGRVEGGCETCSPEEGRPGDCSLECPNKECAGQFVASGLAQWAASLAHMHRRARAGALDQFALTMYQQSRDELERTILAAQQLSSRIRRGRRQAMRLACALQVDLRVSDRTVRAVALDISKRGFAVLLEQTLKVGQVVEFSLRLPGSEYVKGTARVVAARRNDGSTRTSFAFADVPDADLERVQMWIIENVVHQLTLC